VAIFSARRRPRPHLPVRRPWAAAAAAAAAVPGRSRPRRPGPVRWWSRARLQARQEHARATPLWRGLPIPHVPLHLASHADVL